VALTPEQHLNRPPRCTSERERRLLRRMCERAEVEFTEWECARLLTEFKRNLNDLQWAALRADTNNDDPDHALRALIVFGFENRRLKRLRLRGRGRGEGVHSEQAKQRLARLQKKPVRKA
jgi:hypothetical protein